MLDQFTHNRQRTSWFSHRSTSAKPTVSTRMYLCLFFTVLVYSLTVAVFFIFYYSIFSLLRVRTLGSKGCCESDSARPAMDKHTDPTKLSGGTHVTIFTPILKPIDVKSG